MKPPDDLIERNIKFGIKHGLGLDTEDGGAGLTPVIKRMKGAYGSAYSDEELEKMAHEAISELFEEVNVE